MLGYRKLFTLRYNNSRGASSYERMAPEQQLVDSIHWPWRRPRLYGPRMQKFSCLKHSEHANKNKQEKEEKNTRDNIIRISPLRLVSHWNNSCRRRHPRKRNFLLCSKLHFMLVRCVLMSFQLFEVYVFEIYFSIWCRGLPHTRWFMSLHCRKRESVEMWLCRLAKYLTFSTSNHDCLWCNAVFLSHTNLRQLIAQRLLRDTGWMQLAFRQTKHSRAMLWTESCVKAHNDAANLQSL